MSISPNVPEPSGNETNFYEAEPTPRWIIVAFVLAFLMIGYGLYAGNAARNKLETDLAQANSKNAILSVQIDQTNSRVAEARIPSLSSFLPKVNPGVPFSTSTPPIPFAPGSSLMRQ